MIYKNSLHLKTMETEFHPPKRCTFINRKKCNPKQLHKTIMRKKNDKGNEIESHLTHMLDSSCIPLVECLVK